MYRFFFNFETKIELHLVLRR